MNEGGESKLNTNVNAMLEQVGISVNSDSVVGNSCLSEPLVKACSGKKEGDDEKKPGKYSRKYRDTNDDLNNRDQYGGLKFVYPYGSTLNVRKPSCTLLSSGPISFPANRPVGAFYMSLKRGKLFVMGSMQFIHDDF